MTLYMNSDISDFFSISDFQSEPFRQLNQGILIFDHIYFEKINIF